MLYDKLTMQERALMRDVYIADQLGLCYLCGCPLSGPPPIEVSRAVAKYPIHKIFARGFFNYKNHLHHSHKGADAGYTLGVAHAMCNAWLKLFAGE